MQRNGVLSQIAKHCTGASKWLLGINNPFCCEKLELESGELFHDAMHVLTVLRKVVHESYVWLSFWVPFPS